jgi:hypothetical protein
MSLAQSPMAATSHDAWHGLKPVQLPVAVTDHADVSGGVGEGGFELDRGEPAEAALAAPVFVGALGPRSDSGSGDA